MNTVRTAFMTIVAVGLLAAATPALAQAPPPLDGNTGVVTGQIIPVLNLEPGTIERTDPIVEDGRRVAGIESVRNQVWQHQAELSDPRLAGTMTTTWNWDDFDTLTDTSVAWGTITIENEHGSWSGTFTGAEYPAGLMDTHAWMIGSGDYAGLAAFLCLQCPSHGPALAYDADATHAWGASGLVFVGSPPSIAVPGLAAGA